MFWLDFIMVLFEILVRKQESFIIIVAFYLNYKFRNF